MILKSRWTRIQCIGQWQKVPCSNLADQLPPTQGTWGACITVWRPIGQPNKVHAPQALGKSLLVGNYSLSLKVGDFMYDKYELQHQRHSCQDSRTAYTVAIIRLATTSLTFPSGESHPAEERAFPLLGPDYYSR